MIFFCLFLRLLFFHLDNWRILSSNPSRPVQDQEIYKPTATNFQDGTVSLNMTSS